MVHELYSKIYLLCKVGYTLYKGPYGLFFYVTIVHNLIYYSNKYQLFCTCEYSAGGKRGSKVCKSLLKLVNKDGYDATGDKIEIYVRIMDSVHY